MLLYINCCAREESRTKRLANTLLDKLGTYTELNLYAEPLAPINAARLAQRDALLQAQDYGAEMLRYARQFAQADEIVIAAPFWDMSFPSLLKTYIENIFAVGIVCAYAENGIPYGLCKAKKLWYVTTAGGPYDPRFSYEYIKELCQRYFGIPETQLIAADMLDIRGNDPEAILRAAQAGI